MAHDPRNFQRRASEQGDWFEQTCVQALIWAGLDIQSRNETLPFGVQIDIVATNRHGVSFFFECKGSVHGKRPGLRRTDTTKKALCNAFLVRQQLGISMIFLTSHKPHPNTASEMMLISAGRQVVFDVIEPLHDSDRLRWLADATEEMLEEDLKTEATWMGCERRTK